jgi:HD-GYP domain-containing protein (c-di-GMP phosphodiesterase class II)
MSEKNIPEQGDLNKKEIKITDKRSGELQRVILEDFRELKQHHHDTYLHSLRVGLLSIDLGYEEKLDENKINILGYAAHLHDVGKTTIDLSILDKKDKLNENERSEIKEHVRRGIMMLNNFEMKDVKMIMMQHHEYQAGPYPRLYSDRRKENRHNERRLNNLDTDYLGEIIAISDMADALIFPRVYKEPLPIKEVEKILRSEFRGNPALIRRVLNRF